MICFRRSSVGAIQKKSSGGTSSVAMCTGTKPVTEPSPKRSLPCPMTRTADQWGDSAGRTLG